MACRQLAVAEEAQRDPACMELSFHGRRVGLRRVAGGEGIGGLGIATVEQLAGDEPALGPPFVGPDECRRVARRASKDRRGLGDLLRRRRCLTLAKRKAGSPALEAGMAARRAAGIAGLLLEGDAGLGDSDDVGAGSPRGAQAVVEVAVVDEAIGTELVIGARKKRAIGLDERRLESAGQGIVAVGVANERARSAHGRRLR